MKKYLVAAFLFGAMFCASISQVEAMQVSTFDHMSDKDQGNYILHLLAGSVEYLNAHGNPKDAQNIRDFFILSNGGNGPGVVEFFKNLQGVRNVNQQNANDPNNVPFQVEHAFALTLKHEGVIIPVNDLLAIGQNFKPSASVADKSTPAPAH